MLVAHSAQQQLRRCRHYRQVIVVDAVQVAESLTVRVQRAEQLAHVQLEGLPVRRRCALLPFRRGTLVA